MPLVREYDKKCPNSICQGSRRHLRDGDQVRRKPTDAYYKSLAWRDQR